MPAQEGTAIADVIPGITSTDIPKLFKKVLPLLLFQNTKDLRPLIAQLVFLEKLFRKGSDLFHFEGSDANLAISQRQFAHTIHKEFSKVRYSQVDHRPKPLLFIVFNALIVNKSISRPCSY